MNVPADLQDIPFRLTLAEVNQVLEALGRQPYASVFQLIEKIRRQAEARVHESSSERPASQAPESAPTPGPERTNDPNAY